MNQVYNAFVEAGLKEEANRLSTTINGKVQPALGHYIAVVDNILELDKIMPDRQNNAERTAFFSKSVNSIFKSPSINKELHGKLNSIFYNGKVNTK